MNAHAVSDCKHDDDEWLERVGPYLVTCLRCMSSIDVRDMQAGWIVKITAVDMPVRLEKRKDINKPDQKIA